MSRTSAAGDVKRLPLKLLWRLLDIPTAKNTAPRGHRRVLTKAPLLKKRGESLDGTLLQVAKISNKSGDQEYGYKSENHDP